MSTSELTPTPQQIAGMYARSLDFLDFIKRNVDAKYKAAGKSQSKASLFNSGAIPREEFLQNHEPRDKVHAEVRKTVLSQLAEGELQAIGKRKAHDQEAFPELIPWQFWSNARSYYGDHEFCTSKDQFTFIRIVQTADLESSNKLGSSGQGVQLGAKRGRPSSKKKVDQLLLELKNDPEFLGLPSREAQACEVRARLCGEQHRYHRQMKDYKDSSLTRWIGKALGPHE